ncbi:MAG: cell division protein ZapA [Spirochaetales bacterium]|nr:MAG: cell division protein ZapA [Spirochaetales bacterium]
MRKKRKRKSPLQNWIFSDPGRISQQYVMDERVVHIQILGTSFDLRSDEDPDYMNQLITYLHKKIEETRKITGNKDSLRIALLAGLLITDDLFKSRQKGESLFQPETGAAGAEEEEISVITRRILERLDKSLSPPDGR